MVSPWQERRTRKKALRLCSAVALFWTLASDFVAGSPTKAQPLRSTSQRVLRFLDCPSNLVPLQFFQQSGSPLLLDIIPATIHVHLLRALSLSFAYISSFSATSLLALTPPPFPEAPKFLEARFISISSRRTVCLVVTHPCHKSVVLML